LELQGDQLALVDALAATGTPIACVFLASKPLVLTKVAPKVDALLCVFNPGMEGGEAIADILRGTVNPQGRLSVSFPAHAGQQPVAYSQVEGAHHSSYPDLPGTGFYGLFPFGFGLSYTSFKYLFPHVEKAECRRNEPVRLTVTLRNTGNREGVETVQVYMRDLYASMTLPAKRLVAFRRVSLKPREQTDVVFEIPPEAFSFVDADCNRVLEPGDFDLMVGSSSQSFQTVRFRYLP
jgi:beta-glucosidase